MREHVTWTDGRRLYDADDHQGSALTESWPLFCRGPQWFRIKGWGVRYVDHRRHRMSFGERNGYQRALHIGPHCFRWITPYSGLVPRGAKASTLPADVADPSHKSGETA